MTQVQAPSQRGRGHHPHYRFQRGTGRVQQDDHDNLVSFLQEDPSFRRKSTRFPPEPLQVYAAFAGFCVMVLILLLYSW